MPLLVILFLLLGAIAAVADDFRLFSLGLCEDYPKSRRTLAQARLDLDVAQQAGAKSLRIAFSWLEMEPERGRYDFSFWDEFIPLAESHHLQLTPYICYTPEWASSRPGTDGWKAPPRDPRDFARFVAALVARYKDHIHFWELWNEPDNADFWTGTAPAYAALVKAGSRAVRTADPKAKIVLGGIAHDTSFLEKLFRDEAISPAVDVVNLHAYYETWSGEPLETIPAYVNTAADVISRWGRGQKIWMAETGYSSLRGANGRISADYTARRAFEHTAGYQGDALLRAVALAFGTGKVSLLEWYRINDLAPGTSVIGDQNNLHLGIVTVQGNPKPALESFARAAEIFSRPMRPLALTVPLRGSPAQIVVFERDDGLVYTLIWLPVATSESSTKVQFSLPLKGSYKLSLILPSSPEDLPSQSLIISGGKVNGLRLDPHRRFIGIVELAPTK